MDSKPPGGGEWELTSEALDKLLAVLNEDRDLAAIEFEEIRKKLTAFFENRGCSIPGECAETAIYRVAKRVDGGEVIYANPRIHYFYGVAYLVLQEHWRALKTAPEMMGSLLDLEDSVVAKKISENPDKIRAREDEQSDMERELNCLDLCLEALPPKDRAMILGYYKEEKSLKIENRKSLAKKLGIQMNALRIKALRVRKSLEGCLNDCLGKYSVE